MQQKVVWAAVLLAAMLAAGCSRKPHDAAMVTAIKAQMFSDAQLKNATLQVSSQNGQVTLSGSVPTDAARLDAYKIAAQTPGVTKVNDQMTVEAQQVAAAAPESVPPAEPAKPTPEPKHAERARKVYRDSLPDVPTPVPTPAPPVEPAAAPVPPPPPAADAKPPTPEPPPLEQFVVPTGTTLSVRMIDSVTTATDQPGEIFHASLDNPLKINNDVVVPKGADVYVRLVSASRAGRFKGKSELTLGLVKLEYQGRSYPLVSSTYSSDGASQGKKTGEKVGGGAALGAIIGAIAGGGKGAAIGAAAGAGGGGIYQGIGKPKDVTIPSETKLDFQLQQPVTISVMPHAPAAQ